MPTKQCPYAKSDMTPCVLKDGATCWAIGSHDEPICVGCEHGPKTLGAPWPTGWKRTVAAVKRERR